MEDLLSINEKKFTKLLDKDQIDIRIRQIALQIEDTFSDKDPLFIVVMDGALFFAAKLLSCLSIPVEMGSIRLASYAGTERTGIVTLKATPLQDLKGRHVILLEDIIDTGHTLAYLHQYLNQKGVASVHTASLLAKPAVMIPNTRVDFVGFDIGNEFVIGYGLDLDGQGRNLPHVYGLVQED